jgi:hypothetical protein
MEENRFHKEPLLLESNQLNAGMSGAGVLDIKDNLIVGIVSHTNIPDESGRDQNTSFGVDARVLPLPPFGLPFRTEPLLKGLAPEPKFDKKEAEAAVFIKDKYSWNSAPTVLAEWTGRDDLLAQITEDWNNPQKHVTGLIGFGGEGKSSLARKWVDDVIARRALSPTKQSPVDGETTGNKEIASQSALAMTSPDGVFWWGFYENRSIDEFLEAALNYLSGGKIDPRLVPSSSLRADHRRNAWGGTLSLRAGWTRSPAASGRRSVRLAPKQ